MYTIKDEQKNRKSFVSINNEFSQKSKVNIRMFITLHPNHLLCSNIKRIIIIFKKKLLL